MNRLAGKDIDFLRCRVTLPSFSRIVDELVMNALDASATKIECFVRLEGLLFVRVWDNGHGIAPDSMKQLLGGSHSTSKSGSARTFGFRGEALYSLATQAREMEILSSCPGSNLVYKLVKSKPNQLVSRTTNTSTPSFTSVTARDVYHRWPVRRKALVPTKEIVDIQRHLMIILLQHPSVNFSLFQIDSRGQNTIEVMSIRSSASVQLHWLQMHPEFDQTSFGTVAFASGRFGFDLVYSREIVKTNSHQVTYVNGRHVLLPDVCRAVHEILLEKYGTQSKWVERGCKFFTVFCLNIVCKPDEYDILFDPQKAKCCFFDDESLMSSLKQFASKIIGKPCTASTSAVPTVTWQARPAASGALQRNPRRLMKRRVTGETVLPEFSLAQMYENFVATQFEGRPLETNSDEIRVGKFKGVAPARAKEAVPRAELHSLFLIGQFDRKFVIAATKNRQLVCIDQHAASERVNLEKLEDSFLSTLERDGTYRTMSSGTEHERVISPPEKVVLSGLYLKSVARFSKVFEQWNFELVVDEESSSVSIRKRPVIVGVATTVSDFRRFLLSLEETEGASASMPPFVTRILNSKACRTAFMFNDVLTLETCDTLIRELARCRCPYICAHGRPTLSLLASGGNELTERDDTN
jgi:DNA mismatch repair protein MutL